VKPRCLDLFSGAGGATKGYQLAGFHVTGVDVVASPRYCGDEFVQADAMTFPLDGYDLIHASPPCQAYVGWQNIAAARGATNDHPRLIEPLRERLLQAGVPYVIENVPAAPLLSPLMLCGSMFGLGVRRHRKFESLHLMLGLSCRHSGEEVGVYGKLDGRRLFTRSDGTELRNPSSLEHAQAAMGIDWMVWDELREAIPPAFTHFLGDQLWSLVRRRYVMLETGDADV
jgi:DNA (cytosine-5)-methyltransferase 1